LLLLRFNSWSFLTSTIMLIQGYLSVNKISFNISRTLAPKLEIPFKDHFLISSLVWLAQIEFLAIPLILSQTQLPPNKTQLLIQFRLQRIKSCMLLLQKRIINIKFKKPYWIIFTVPLKYLPLSNEKSN